jgi:hypothetical protein
MTRVQIVFHFLNIHFSTHGQDPPKKGAKNPTAMAITKFNLGLQGCRHFRTAQSYV